MGNSENFSKDDYYIHIKLIGLNMKKFNERIKNVTVPEKKIKNYWEFDYNENQKDITEEINIYFNKLKDRIEKYEDDLDNDRNDSNIDMKNMKEVLIFKIDNYLPNKDNQKNGVNSNSNFIKSPEIDIILTKLDELEYTHFMPIVLLLTTQKDKFKLDISSVKYKHIDPRLIFITLYDETPKFIDKVIDKLLLGFCSIHNELGDRFSIKDPDFSCDYDLTDEYFPFNLNIACIGQFGQGKSTGVNKLLQEYKAKESSQGCSQTKRLNYYHVRNQPVKILDIPGFNDDNTVNEVVQQFKFCFEEMNRIKDNLHIILYFLNYHNIRTFIKSETPIFNEIKNHKSSKIIYVITHCNPNMNDSEKKKFIRAMKEGLNDIVEDPEKNLVPSSENVVFLNFHFDNNTNFESFGEKELYQKIHDIFIKSETYQKSLNEKKTGETIEKEALKLREMAKDALLSNKIFGAAIGALPGVDWLVQRFLIKKNAVKKVGKIFGIDIKFIHENSERERNNVNVNEFNPKIKGGIKDTLKNSVKIAGETGIFIKGGQKIANGIKIINKCSDVCKLCTSGIDNCISMTQIASEQISSLSFFEKIFTNNLEVSKNFITKASNYAEKFSAMASIANKHIEGAKIITVNGLKWTIAGCFTGIGLGGYFTHKFCEDLLDEFVEYYKKNAEKMSNSYEYAVNYFKYLCSK